MVWMRSSVGFGFVEEEGEEEGVVSLVGVIGAVEVLEEVVVDIVAGPAVREPSLKKMVINAGES